MRTLFIREKALLEVWLDITEPSSSPLSSDSSIILSSLTMTVYKKLLLCKSPATNEQVVPSSNAYVKSGKSTSVALSSKSASPKLSFYPSNRPTLRFSKGSLLLKESLSP